MKARVGLTWGDPRGIGPEIIKSCLQDPYLLEKADFVVYGPSLDQQKDLLFATDSVVGHAVVSYLNAAAEDALSGVIDAIVTAPITKKSLESASYSWPGHTEFFAEKSGGHYPVMMMAADRLKVSLVTIHTPLKEVSCQMSQEKIIQTTKITYDALLKYWGIVEPKIGVCGLNPHSGEQGLLGNEEIEVIKPALKKLSEQGYKVEGPLVPDVVFYDAYHGRYDALICMYHDQGLIPFKMLYRDEGVNVTLGLPIIRTSPDHGVAFDIAGKGIADASSMKHAIKLAIQMALTRKK